MIKAAQEVEKAMMAEPSVASTVCQEQHFMLPILHAETGFFMNKKGRETFDRNIAEIKEMVKASDNYTQVQQAMMAELGTNANENKLTGSPIVRYGKAYEIDHNNPVSAEVLAAGWEYLHMVPEPARYTPIRISDEEITELTARFQSTKPSRGKKEVKKRQQQKKHARKHRS